MIASDVEFQVRVYLGELKYTDVQQIDGQTAKLLSCGRV